MAGGSKDVKCDLRRHEAVLCKAVTELVLDYKSQRQKEERVSAEVVLNQENVVV